MARKGQGANARPSAAAENSKEPKMDIKSILKDIEFLGITNIGIFQQSNIMVVSCRVFIIS